MDYPRLLRRFFKGPLGTLGIFLAAILAVTPMLLAQEVSVTVRIENLAPPNGNFLTPFWVGFHDGSFDIYNIGAAAGAGLESLAEDGATATLSAEFLASGAGTVDGTIVSGGPIPPLPPGENTRMTFSLDPNSANSLYFSYASMVIPSNDAFVANGDPMAHRVFDDNGNFLGISFIVLASGSTVLDAGTEVNDEIPANTAFFGQAAPNTGVAEGGTVQVHPGFMPAGSGGILDDPMFSAADFTVPDYRIARITVGLGEGQDLNFAQFGEGGGLFGQLSLFGLLNETESMATVILKDDDGGPLSVDLNGAVVDGEMQVTIPATGVLVLRSDGLGPVTAGSITVRSTQPVNGVVFFGGSTGLAAMGHRARFVTEFNWDRPVDFSDFSGLLKVTASGKTAATVLRTGPNQLASVSVVPQ